MDNPRKGPSESCRRELRGLSLLGLVRVSRVMPDFRHACGRANLGIQFFRKLIEVPIAASHAVQVACTGWTRGFGSGLAPQCTKLGMILQQDMGTAKRPERDLGLHSAACSPGGLRCP